MLMCQHAGATAGASMVRIADEAPTRAGTWLTFEQSGEELYALVHSSDEEPEPGVTVYWPAMRSPSRFLSFFDVASKRVTDRSDRLSFERRILFDRDSGEPQDFDGSEESFDLADFIRLERISVGAEGNEHPILVAWANLDSGGGPEIPVDAGGVLFQPRHLRGLLQPLSDLIATTSFEMTAIGDIAAMLGELDAYLRPDSDSRKYEAVG